MPDYYDTRSFPQGLIDAILEIWDTAGSDEQRSVSTESQVLQDTGAVLLAAD